MNYEETRWRHFKKRLRNWKPRRVRYGQKGYFDDRRTSLWRGWGCATWGWWTGRTFCCSRRKDRRRAGRPCGCARASWGWSRARNACRSPRTCTGTASRPCAPAGAAWAWTTRRRPCRTRRTRGRAARACAGACASPNCRGTSWCSPCADTRSSGSGLRSPAPSSASSCSRTKPVRITTTPSNWSKSLKKKNQIRSFFFSRNN